MELRPIDRNILFVVTILFFYLLSPKCFGFLKKANFLYFPLRKY